MRNDPTALVPPSHEKEDQASPQGPGSPLSEPDQQSVVGRMTSGKLPVPEVTQHHRVDRTALDHALAKGWLV